MTRRQFLALILPLLTVLLGFIVITILERTGHTGAPSWDDDFARSIRLAMADEYVYGVDDKNLQREAYFNSLRAYVQTFDPYANVVPPWELDAEKEFASGQYGGVGIRTEGREGAVESVLVIGVAPGGPADQAGVGVGDRIVGVGAATVADLTERPAALEEAIRGPRGSKVRLRLRAPDGRERDVEVERAEIESGSVFGARMADADAKIAYLRIKRFHAKTAATVRERLEQFVADGARGLVLDLRQNYGGFLDEFVRVAGLFLDEGLILREVGRGPGYPRAWHAEPGDTVAADLPVVVLVDRGSASASEILAGALQDRRHAVLVGERTFGKFLVQTVDERYMEFGPVLFKRTTAVYETPLGRRYPRLDAERRGALDGLIPDVRVGLQPEERETLARVFLDEEYADWNPDWTPAHPDFRDPQIEAAVALLKGEPVTPPLPE